jgi:hypothetical protein
MMVAMTERYHTASGWSVEIVRRTATPDHRDGESFRVCRFGCYVADVRTPAELERYFPLAELEPESLRGRKFTETYWYQSSLPSPRRSWTSQLIRRYVRIWVNGSGSQYQASTVTGTQV